MRAFAVVIIVIGLCGSVLAAPSSECKKCGEQQRACKANYAAKICKTEYDICLKGCRR
jgi:hypothetical protein